MSAMYFMRCGISKTTAASAGSRNTVNRSTQMRNEPAMKAPNAQVCSDAKHKCSSGRRLVIGMRVHLCDANS